MKKLYSKLQYFIPHHLLSRGIAKLADCKIKFIKNALISLFISAYKIDLESAVCANSKEYKSFNEFFTRALKPGARPIASGENSIACPADGIISQAGTIQNGEIFQAKGKTYTLKRLLANQSSYIKEFEAGNFLTIYLAPKNYHRVHMPLDGKLLQTLYVPGRLFSVNRLSVDTTSNLFCNNERLICLFQTKIGQIAIIMVGAMLVAGIETVWEPQGRIKGLKDYTHEEIFLKKGDEMGHFKFGSTVILLFPTNSVRLNDLQSGKEINMGDPLGLTKDK